jgi:hypothetical protein
VGHAPSLPGFGWALELLLIRKLAGSAIGPPSRLLTHQPNGDQLMPTTAQDLIAMNAKTKDYIVDKALETYGIAAHFSTEDLPVLDDSEPLRDMVNHIVRMVGAVVLSNISTSMIGDHSAVLQGMALAFGDMATELDLIAVEYATEA